MSAAMVMLDDLTERIVLSDEKHLDSLRVLRIDAGVTMESAKELLRSPLGRRLELLDLRHKPDPFMKELQAMGWDGLLEAVAEPL